MLWKKFVVALKENLGKKSVIKSWLVSYIAVILVMLILVLCAGNIFLNIVVDNTVRLKMEEISTFSNKMDMLTEECKIYAIKLTSDERFMEYFTNVPDTKEHYELRGVANQFRRDMKFVNEFFVYLREDNIIINSLGHITTPKHYYDIYYKNAGMDYETWASEFLNCRYSGYHVFENNEKNPVEGFAKFCYALPLDQLYAKKVTVFTEIDSSSYERELSKLDLDGEISVLIYDDSGSRYFKKGDNIPGEAQLAESETVGEFHETEISGKKVVMHVSSSAFATWKYAFVIPYSVFWERLIQVRYIGCAIFILMATMGILGIYLITKYNYKAVANIIKRIESTFSVSGNKSENEYARINKMIDVASQYSKRVENQHKQERENVVLKLLLGVVDDDSAKRSDLFPTDVFVVAVFCAPSYEKLFENENISESEKGNAVKLIITNIFTELLEEYGTVDIADMENMTFLFSPKKKYTTNAENIVVEKAKEMQKIISQHFEVDIICGVSSRVNGVSDICIAYREALSALNTVTQKNNAGIEVYSKKSILSKSYYYPLDQMQYLITLLSDGDKENALRQIGIILEINSAVFEVDNLAKALITDIAATIMKAALGIGYKIDAEKLMGCVKSPNRAVIEKIFKSYVNDICEFQKNGSEGREQSLIEKIDSIISENYTNTEFNVNLIADMLDVSPNSLSVVYKRKTDKNILEVIQSLRVNEAKRLLSESDEILEVVAEKSGFGSNTTFRRVFKKVTGVSPGSYREMKRRNKEG